MVMNSIGDAIQCSGIAQVRHCEKSNEAIVNQQINSLWNFYRFANSNLDMLMHCNY